MNVVDPGLRTASVLHFAQFALDLRRAELACNGAAVALRPKAFALLSYFADNPGRVLGKDELLAAVWPGVIVTDDSLSQCINEVRGALGDRDHRLIKTVPRRGYLFDARVDSAPAAPNGHVVDFGPAMPVPADEPSAPSKPTNVGTRTQPPMRLLWIGIALAAAVTVAAAATIWLRDDAALPLDRAVAARRSIAVMPFSTVGSEKRDYFSEAITADVISAVAKLPSTWVIAQASAAAVGARETDVRKIGRELGVHYVLTGSVRRDGAAVHVAVQFAASDTGVLLWSQRFEYPTVADWTWQQDVGMRIARTLDRRMTFAAAPASEARGTRPDVVEAVMQGHYLLRRSTARADLARARSLFEQALAVEPDSVSALCGLAMAHMAEVRTLHSTDPKEQTALAARAVQRALTLAPNSPQAHYAMGHVLYVRGDLDGALREYQLALEGNPSDSFAHMRVGMTKLYLGHLEDVPAHMALAQKLNPLEGTLVGTATLGLGIAEFMLGNEDAAYERFRQAGITNPSLVQPWVWMSAVDALHGRSTQAKENLDRALRLRPGLTVSSAQFIQRDSPPPRLRPGTERFREGLMKAGLPE
jgi:DNA-binding winged helix-turn-helix (wHTH) protein/TolB-like protein